MNATGLSSNMSLIGFTALGPALSQDLNAYIAFDSSFYNVVLLSRPIHGILGTIGSLLLLITLIRNKDFAEPCFICYKALAVAGLFYAICEIFNPVYRIMVQFGLPGNRYISANYTISWIRSIFMNTVYTITEHISLYLITFLSCQRAVACLLPSKFYLLNTTKVCAFVTAVVILIPIGYCIPMLIFEDVIMSKSGYGRWFPSTVGYETYANAKDSIYLVQVPLVLISSGLAIAGIVRVIWHKRKLIRILGSMPSSQTPADPNPSNAVNLASTTAVRNRDDLKSTKRNLQLCYLQLSQAVPLAAYCAVVSQANWWFNTAQFNYHSDGSVDMAYSYNWTWIRQMDMILESLANDYHFYLILVFSQKFRKQFKRRMFEMFKR